MASEGNVFSRAEVRAYYTVRVPSLTQTRGQEWRGPCAIHGGKKNNLVIKAENGLWFCYSECGRGGDILDFEMALNRSGFAEARRNVFTIMGRPNVLYPLYGSQRNGSAQAERDRHDRVSAELWRRALLRRVETELTAQKAVLFDQPECSIEQTGEEIHALTMIESRFRAVSPSDLLRAYRHQVAHNPIGTKRMVLEATADEADALRWAGFVLPHACGSHAGE